MGRKKNQDQMSKRKRKKIEGPESTFSIEEADITQVLEEEYLFLEDLRELPPDYEQLQWYRMSENPCLMGDDVYFAQGNGKSWFTFDGWVNELNYTGTHEEFARMLALNPEKLDKYRGECNG